MIAGNWVYFTIGFIVFMIQVFLNSQILLSVWGTAWAIFLGFLSGFAGQAGKKMFDWLIATVKPWFNVKKRE